jgi:hypothetical protein
MTDLENTSPKRLQFSNGKREHEFSRHENPHAGKSLNLWFPLEMNSPGVIFLLCGLEWKNERVEMNESTYNTPEIIGI